MPGSYPVLSTGSSFCYPVKRRLIQRAGAHVFANFSQVRYKKGSTRTEFEFTYSRIKTVDKDTLRAFYEAQKGDYYTDWTLAFDGMIYTKCQFVGPFAPRAIGPKLWSLTLHVRTGPSVPGIPTNEAGSPLVAANLVVVASFTPDTTGMGIPYLVGVYGAASSNNGFQLGSGSGIGGSPTTLTYAIPTENLSSFFNLGIVAYIDGTLGGTVFSPSRSTLNIYDVYVQSTYQDGTTGTVRAVGTTQSTGTGSGIFYGGVQGQVTNAGGAIDGDTSTFASVTRDFYDPLASPGYLQVLSFQFPNYAVA